MKKKIDSLANGSDAGAPRAVPSVSQEL